MNKPLTKETILPPYWVDASTQRYFTFDGIDVLSAVKGLKNFRLRIPQENEEFSTCDDCNLYPKVWIDFDKDNNGKYDYQICFDCWINYWFPVFAEQNKGDEE